VKGHIRKERSSWGRGGMESKVQAAEIAARGGVATVVAAGKEPHILIRVLKLMGPMIFGLSFTQIGIVLDRLIALIPGEGTISVLYYGNRLVELPLAIIGNSIAVAAFPVLSRNASSGRMGEFGETLQRSLRTVIFLSIPAMFGLMLVARPLVSLCFQHGEFSVAALERTVWVVYLYAIGIWAYTGIHVLTRAFYALQETWTPVKIGALMVGFNVALSLALVGPMAEKGLALATSVAFAGNFLLLAFALQRRGTKVWDLSFLGCLTRTLGLSIGMILAGWGVLTVWQPQGAWLEALRLLVITLGGFALVLFGGRALGISEAKELLASFRKRIEQ